MLVACDAIIAIVAAGSGVVCSSRAFCARIGTCGCTGLPDCGIRQARICRRARKKSEVFHVGGGVIRSVMRYNGTTVLETTQHEGLFQLDRLDNGRRAKFEPQTDLKKLFPLKPGRSVGAKFISESNGRQATLSVDLAVKGADVLYIGPCKYNVLKIERSESRSTDPPRFVDTDYYSRS
jgi:hypothetical protein